MKKKQAAKDLTSDVPGIGIAGPPEPDERSAGEALAASELRYRRLFETAKDGILILDAETGMVIDVNPFLISLLGYSYEQFVGKAVWELGFFRDIVANQENFAELQRKEYIRYEDKPLETASGRRVDVEFVSNVYLVNSKRVIQCNIRDITERKHMADSLHREQEFARSLLDNITDGVVACDAQGTLVLFNRTAREWHGMDARALPPEEWGRHYDLCGPDGTEPLSTESIPLVRAFRGETIHDVEMTIRAKGQPLRHVLAGGSPFFDAHHNLLGAVSIMRDITGHRQTENIRDRLAMAVEQAAEAIVITDPAGTILYVNPAFEKVSGYTSVEAIGQNPRILKSGEQDAEFYRQMWATLTDGKAWNGRLINKHKNGTLFEEEASISPVRDAAGRIVNYVAVKRDITREVQLESQFRQAQKMEAVGRLAGGVAHDFNNMLGIIIGYTEMALNQSDPAQPIFANLQEIQTAAERSASLTRQLLAFARMQTIAPKVVNLNDAVAGMLKMLRRLIGEDIRLAWLPGADLHSVRIDPSQVDQILANLCLNARDAIADTGMITLETGNVIISKTYCAEHVEAVPGNYVFLSVSDDGCGMNQEVLAHIFEPFFSTKEVGKGSGLGLATVYGIVRQNGGFIYAYSEPGLGTTFKIYLPQVAAEILETPVPAAVQAPAGRGETILLVEDEPSLRTVYKRILDGLGYSVLLAGTPAEALELSALHTEGIELLLTDVVMPGMNGRQLAEQISATRPGIKVLFMSGYTADMMIERGVLEQSKAFISKPFTSDDLARKVVDVLETRKPVKEPA